MPSLHTVLSVLSVLCASIEELAACVNSALNNSTETHALTMTMSMSSISSNSDSIFGGKIP